MAWGWETFQQMSIFGWTIPVFNAMHLLWFLSNATLFFCEGWETCKASPFKKRRERLCCEEHCSHHRWGNPVSEIRHTGHRNSQEVREKHLPAPEGCQRWHRRGSGARVWWTSTKLSSPWRVRCWDAQLCERHHSKHKRAERDAWHSTVQEKTRILLVKLHNI